MSGSLSINASRTTTLLASSQLLSSLRNTQSALLELQNQIETGRKIDKPSDDPVRTASILLLESTIEARGQHERNLQRAMSLLNTTDAALADGTDILLEAKTIASSQVGIGSDAATRANEAVVIDAQLHALIDLANRQFQGVSLFGGSAGAAKDEPVFVDFLGGVRYLGARGDLLGDVGEGSLLGINSNGTDVFAALSTRVISQIDFDPQATANTHIVDVNGAQGVPVRLGEISVTVDGTLVNVDLAGSETLGDVVLRIQTAIDDTPSGAGTITISGAGFHLAGNIIAIADIGAGQTAADLGINLTAPGQGADLDPRLTLQTELAALGASLDLAGGLTISQDALSKVADLSQAVTVQDLVNEVKQLGLAVRIEINDDQTALNLVSEVSGPQLSVGENGGSTAADLGLRTYGKQTRLDDLRFGLGVEIQPDEDDFAIKLHDGSSINVNLDGITNIGQVITAIEQLAATAGFTVGSPGEVGTDFNVGLAPVGNGLFFEDRTAGAADFRVMQLGVSLAATHLGIYNNVEDADALQGEDIASVRVNSVFTHLINLRDSLKNDGQIGITLAGEDLGNDLELFARVRASIGSRVKRAEQQQERSQQLKIAEQQLLSDIQDTDLTEAITRFVQLQQQLQATLSVGSSSLQLSLIDFLR